MKIGQMIGSFTGGAISGTVGGVIKAAELTGVVGTVITVTTSGTADATGGIVENFIAGEEIIPDDVGSDFGWGAITGFVPSTGRMEFDILLSESLSSNKKIIVEYINEKWDPFDEYIREKYTMPSEQPPINSLNQNVADW